MSNVNGTMNRKMAEKVAQANLDEVIEKQRNLFLSKVGASIMMQLDTFLGDEHDKLSVLAGLLAHMAVRANGSWEELRDNMQKLFNKQSEAFAAASKSEPEAPQTQLVQAP